MNGIPTIETALVQARRDDLVRQAERARLARTARSARTPGARPVARLSLRVLLHLAPVTAR